MSSTTNRDSVRVCIRLRGGISKTQEIQKDNKAAQTVCVFPEQSSPDNNSSNNRNHFNEIVVDKLLFASTTSFTTTNKEKDRFTFDTVFGSESTQESIYEEVGKPALQSALEGFNSCIMAFGQTSSGKTFTILGNPEKLEESLSEELNEHAGLVPRVLVKLFEKLQSLPEGEMTWNVEISVVELYNENFYDLLNYPLIQSATEGSHTMTTVLSDGEFVQTATTSQDQSGGGSGYHQLLRIREDRGTGGRGIYIEGLTKRNIKNPQQGLRCILEASKRTHVAETGMNRTSSRSHTIVQLFISQTNHVNGGSKLSSQFFLVDLAGSERVSRTGAAGNLLKEAQSINLSLTLLGNVINKLTDGTSKHIPYRDSKLTRLLQDALGGNSTTTLLCTTSVLAVDAQETVLTLQFATRAKSIKNAPRANVELSGDALKEAYARSQDEIATLKVKIRLLEAEVVILSLNHQQGKIGGIGPTPAPPSTTNQLHMMRRTSSVMSSNAPSTKPSTPASVTTMVGTLRKGTSFSNNGTKTPTINPQQQQRQQHLQSAGQVSSFFENIVLEDLQSTIASLITDLNTEKEERQFLVNERDDAIKRVDFHVAKEKELLRKVEEMEKSLEQQICRVQQLEKESEERKENERRNPEFERSQLQRRLSELMTSASSQQSPIAPVSSLASLATEEKYQTELTQLRQKVTTLTNKLANNTDVEEERKAMNQKLEDMEIRHQQELAEIKFECRKANRLLEEEMLRLTNKLDVRVAEVAKLKQELDESEETKEILRSKVRSAHDSIQSVLSDEHQNAAVLHMENRRNGERIRELAEKNEKHEQTIKESRREIDSLLRDIENAPISEDVKKKLLLRDALQKQRSLFKKKLLDCFSYDG